MGGWVLAGRIPGQDLAMSESQRDGIGQQCRAETAPLLEPALGA
jgi:hypothetical protein